MIGAANVYPNYGDIEGTWAQKDKGIGNEFIEVCAAFVSDWYICMYAKQLHGPATQL